MPLINTNADASSAARGLLSSTSILCVCEQRRLRRVCICADSPDSSLFTYAISKWTLISCTGSYIDICWFPRIYVIRYKSRFLYRSIIFAWSFIFIISHNATVSFQGGSFQRYHSLPSRPVKALSINLLKIKTYFEYTQLFILIRSTRSLQSKYDGFSLSFFCFSYS